MITLSQSEATCSLRFDFSMRGTLSIIIRLLLHVSSFSNTVKECYKRFSNFFNLPLFQSPNQNQLDFLQLYRFVDTQYQHLILPKLDWARDQQIHDETLVSHSVQRYLKNEVNHLISQLILIH